MRHRGIPTPCPAMVVALIALIVALGGTSYAAFRLPTNSVGTTQLKRGAVTTNKLHNGAVTTAKLANGAVTGSKMSFTGVTVPNSTNASHANSAGSAPPSGAAGGDLGGSYPNPMVLNAQKLDGQTPGQLTSSTTLGAFNAFDPPGNPDRTLAQTTITTSAVSNVLALGHTDDDFMCNSGPCDLHTGLYLDGQPIPNSDIVLSVANGGFGSFDDREDFALATGVPAGTHVISLKSKVVLGSGSQGFAGDIVGVVVTPGQ